MTIEAPDPVHDRVLASLESVRVRIEMLARARPTHGRAFALALTKLDETRLWLNEAMRDG